MGEAEDMETNATWSGGNSDTLPKAPFSMEVFNILGLVFETSACGLMAILGLISNTVNIIIFYRQGIMSHSAKVSMAGLAVSDWWVCFFGAWGSVCGLLQYAEIYESTWKWDVGYFLVLTSSRPMNLVTQLSCLITAFMALERAISVTFPLKVKAIFTPKRTLGGIGCIVSFAVLLHIIPSIEYYPTWRKNPTNNVTYLGYLLTGWISQDVNDFYVLVDSLILRFTTIVSVTLCNIIIFWKVNLSQKFKQQSTLQYSDKSKATSTNSHAQASSNKDKIQIQEVTGTNHVNPNATKEAKLLRMITVVSVVFSCCYSTYVPYAIALRVVLEYNVDYNWQYDYFTYGVMNFFQLINSSVNFIIYYNMSSSYKEELKLCFSVKPKSK